MRSEDTDRKLAELDRELMKLRISQLYDFRMVEDIKQILALGVPDVVFRSHGWRNKPGFAEFRGPEEIKCALNGLHTQYDNLGYELHDILIDGNTAAVRRTTTLRHRGTGRQAEIDACDFVTFRDGYITEFEIFPDTDAMAYIDAEGEA